MRSKCQWDLDYMANVVEVLSKGNAVMVSTCQYVAAGRCLLEAKQLTLIVELNEPDSQAQWCLGLHRDNEVTLAH